MHENAAKERKPIRWLVAFVTLSETASVAIVAQNVYEAFALAVRHPGGQFSLPKSAIVTPILNSMIAFSVQCFFACIKGDLSKTKSITLPATIVYLAGNVACDSVITASMIFVLIGLKMAVIPHATQRLLNRLMVNSIENGLITTICVTLNLVFCVTRYEDGIQFALYVYFRPVP
ncbi:hypothetical protein EST38_g5950 [Candolleomyces aberdarensis]|uniref:DUF6534 domain-containing protein n=1 Tax=Candolleomyces aberdarensis TaxID=2316362 RepID=A0A4Q2DJA6_9AGAR|nr:hypothetical protein EST38_g5950 [Candolleomyces aberdarensis]